MFRKFTKTTLLCATAFFVIGCNGSGGGSSNSNTTPSNTTSIEQDSGTNQLMLLVKPSTTQVAALQSATPTQAKQIKQELMAPLTKDQMLQIRAAVRDNVIDFAPLALGGRVLAFEQNLTISQLENAITQISKLSFVQKVVADTTGGISSIEPVYQQWYQFNQSNGAAQNCVTAWWLPPCPSPDTLYYGANFYNGTTLAFNNEAAQGQNITIAVIDTGYVPHPNFINSNLVKYDNSEYFGYNFISNCVSDGSCPSDTPLDKQYQAPYANAQDKNKRDVFHGTAIISQIVGQGGGGVAGAAPKANMIPIRVVGSLLHASDVINAFLFAGNLHPTIENNKPAQVISVSITTDIVGLPCSELMQSAIDQLVAQNVVIAGASGNNSTISMSEPINCKGVIPVAAVAPNKTITSYSNITSDVFIAAPGGGTDLSIEGMYMANYASAPYGSCTLGDACFNYIFQVGTSFAAPLVAAAAADILSIKPTLTLPQVKEILTKSSKPFVGGGTKDNCNTVACLPATVGMLDAKAAIDLATQY